MSQWYELFLYVLKSDSHWDREVVVVVVVEIAVNKISH